MTWYAAIPNLFFFLLVPIELTTTVNMASGKAGMLCIRLAQQLAFQRNLQVDLNRHQKCAIRSSSTRHLARRLAHCHSNSGLATSVHVSEAAMRAPTGVSLPSLYDANNRQQQLGPRGVESFFVNKQRLKIATYFWPSEVSDKTKAVVLAVHGHGAHIQNEYLRRQGPGKPKVYQGSWVQAFNKAGYSVCGIDQQGLGFSEGARSLRCYVEAFDDYIRDVVQLRRSLDSCKVDGYAGKPVFLLGASLGGCIAVNAIHRHGDLFRGAMLLAPMLSLERLSNKGINKYLKPIAHLISWLIPTWPVVEVNRNTMYPDIQAEWDQDPLVFHGKTRARNASEYMKVTEWIVANMSKFNFPVISFCSENDTMCDPDGSRMLIDQSQSKDATLRNVNHMWHVLVAEDGNEKICAELIEWMNQRHS